MSRAEHIHYIKCKISKGIGIICKAKKVLKQIQIVMSLLLFYLCIIHENSLKIAKLPCHCHSVMSYGTNI